MGAEYSVEVCRELAGLFESAGVARPMRVERYDAGTELTYDVTGVRPAAPARVRLEVERFVGGGFAGQVYRAVVREIRGEAGTDTIPDLEVGGGYAVKILVPPSRFARAFRNAIYAAGLQAPFQLQVNPAAARAGALLQKLIRRAAALRFGSERAVVDVLATFVDPTIGACGEISEWIDGRTWRFEVDDDLFARGARMGGAEGGETGNIPTSAVGGLGHEATGSAEYLAKKRFMRAFVRLLRDIGAGELARQYEWWTLKSQPNVLKRTADGDAPAAGLTAVDFRAGLALLAVLPMSPGDVPLIARGLLRGRLVQFDRPDMRRLRRFVEAHVEHFADMRPLLEELAAAERQYRDGQLDVTGHHVRLLYDGELWRRIGDASVTGWRVGNLIDDAAERRLRRSRARAGVFWLLGLLPVLGGLLRKCWCRADWREHYDRLLGGGDYLLRAFRARAAEKLIAWHRRGRVSAATARRLAGKPLLFLLHVPLGILPAGLHRMLTDPAYARDKLAYVFVRPVRLYFNAAAREQWLRDMLAEGRRNHMVSDEDAERILSRVGEPFIQKYLKSLAVHVCTLPVTQMVSVTVAVWYCLANNLPWDRAWKVAGVILLAFQVTPISPGSLTRGLYVLWLVLRERNFRDYNIAVFLGFFKYVGYLAFPIQMAYRYPALARFMAAHWATGAVHVVPVFGERGALLEHWVFDVFYNYPLTVRRRMRMVAEARSKLPPRRWHTGAVAAGGAAALAGLDAAVWASRGLVPVLRDVWAPALCVPLLAGGLAAALAGGLRTGPRVVLGVLAGLGAAVGGWCAHVALAGAAGSAVAPGAAFWDLLWRAFLFSLVAAVSALFVETHARPPRAAGPAPQQAAVGSVE